MAKWEINIIGTRDDILVCTGRNKRFYDEAGFHPSEARELRRYLYWLVEQVMNDLTDDGGSGD